MLPGRTFDIRAAPCKLIEGLEPSPILPFTPQETCSRVEQFAPVARARQKHGGVLFVADRLCRLRDAEIAVGRVHRFGNRLLHSIGGDIAEAKIVLYPAS